MNQPTHEMAPPPSRRIPLALALAVLAIAALAARPNRTTPIPAPTHLRIVDASLEAPPILQAVALATTAGLGVTYTESGLPDDHDCDTDDQTTVTASATAAADYVCLGRQGKVRSAQTINVRVTGEQTRCGHTITGTILLHAPSATLRCRHHRRLALRSLKWSGAVVSDITHGVSASPVIR